MSTKSYIKNQKIKSGYDTEFNHKHTWSSRVSEFSLFQIFQLLRATTFLMVLSLAIKTDDLFQINGRNYVGFDFCIRALVRLSNLSISLFFRMRNTFPFSITMINGLDKSLRVVSRSFLHAGFSHLKHVMQVHQCLIKVIHISV